MHGLVPSAPRGPNDTVDPTRGEARPERQEAPRILEHRAPSPLTRGRVERDRRAVLTWIEEGPGADLALGSPPSAYNPYPLVIDRGTLARQARLHAALVRALSALVAAHDSDPRIRDTLKLSERQRSLLAAADLPPWHLGVIRPDFLHDARGEMRVCEINARFAVNGFFMTAGAARYLGELPELRDVGADASPLAAGIEARYLELFSGPEIAILKGREKGYDVHMLARRLAREGKSVRFVPPEALTLSHGVLADDHGPIRQALLELHQSEIEALDPSIQEAILRLPVCLNDLRTIFLVHDKRMLSLLSSPEVLADHVSGEDAELLLRHILPTRVLSSLSSWAYEDVIQSKERWVLKPNLFGKGEGIVFGLRVDDDAWREALTDPAHAEFILQPYVEQPQLDIVDMSHTLEGARADEPALRTSMNLVGTLLSFDEAFFGPGIYRASPGDLVAVSRGGTILTPAVDLSDASKVEAS